MLIILLSNFTTSGFIWIIFFTVSYQVLINFVHGWEAAALIWSGFYPQSIANHTSGNIQGLTLVLCPTFTAYWSNGATLVEIPACFELSVVGQVCKLAKVVKQAEACYTSVLEEPQECIACNYVMCNSSSNMHVCHTRSCQQIWLLRKT